MTFNCKLNLQKAPSTMFDWVLNKPLGSSVFQEQKDLQLR